MIDEKDPYNCTLEELVALERTVYDRLDELDPDDAEDVLTLVRVARQAMAGKIDDIALLSKSLDARMDELKKAYERQKGRLERASRKVKGIVEQAIILRDMGPKLSGEIYSAARVPTYSCVVNNPNDVPDNLKNVEVAIRAVFPATNQEELAYWQAVIDQQTVNPWVETKVSYIPLKNDIKAKLRKEPNSVLGAELETNYHVRWHAASTTKSIKGEQGG